MSERFDNVIDFRPRRILNEMRAYEVRVLMPNAGLMCFSFMGNFDLDVARDIAFEKWGSYGAVEILEVDVRH